MRGKIEVLQTPKTPKIQSSEKVERHQSLGQKSCRTKVSRILSKYLPEFCPEFCFEFCPNLWMSFRASFHGKRRPQKNHKKKPPFFNAKFPGRFEEKIHTKIFWRAGKVTIKRALQRTVTHQDSERSMPLLT